MWRVTASVVGAAFRCLVAITLLAADWLIWQMLFTRYDERWIRPTKRPSSWPKGLKTELLLRQDYLCVYCGQRKNSPSFEIDHLNPARRGGPNDPDNLQGLCKPCNRRKWAMTDREFRARYARLVPATALTPPPYPVSQAAFTRETLRTDEPASLRRLRRRGSISPRRRVVIGSLVCGGGDFLRGAVRPLAGGRQRLPAPGTGPGRWGMRRTRTAAEGARHRRDGGGLAGQPDPIAEDARQPGIQVACSMPSAARWYLRPEGRWLEPWLTWPATPPVGRQVGLRWTVACGSPRMRVGSAESTNGMRLRVSAS